MSGSAYANGGGKYVATLADIEEIEAIPLADRNLPSTTYEMLRNGASLAPAAPALSFFIRASDYAQPFVWSHADLLRDITRAANAFRRLGIERGDVIAFVLPNLPETHFVIWGGEAAGIAFAINPLLDSRQIAELLRAGEAKWLVTLAPTPGLDLWEKASLAAVAAPALNGVLTVDALRYFSRGASPVGNALAAPREGLAVLDLRLEMSRESGDQLNFATPPGDDLSSYFCTGGTTGLPKIAKRTQFSEVFDSWAMQFVTWGASAPPRTFFCGLPLFHVNGQLVTGLAPWSGGGHVVLATPQGYRDKGVIEKFWEIVEHYRVNAFSGVPTVYAALLQVPIGPHDLSSLAFGACGAAPMPVELFRAFEATTNIRIIEAFGLTEGACVSSINPRGGESRIGSVGLRLLYQDMAVMILDNAGAFVRFAESDEVGILAISGPNVFAGYVNPLHNVGIWIDFDGKPWLNTGDLARRDSDGYFWLTGRKKELIIRGGHNIDPKGIEESVSRHPAVALAAAIGRPDIYAGEIPVVYVQLKAGANASEAELLDFAIAHIPERAAHPKSVTILPAMPLTAVGKIFKPALAMREIEEIVRAEAAATSTQVTSLEVVQNPRRGVLARASVIGDGSALSIAIGRYAFAAEITPTIQKG